MLYLSVLVIGSQQRQLSFRRYVIGRVVGDIYPPLSVANAKGHSDCGVAHVSSSTTRSIVRMRRAEREEEATSGCSPTTTAHHHIHTRSSCAMMILAMILTG